MIQRIFVSGIGGIVGAAGSFLLAPFIGQFGPVAELFAAGFLGSFLTSLFVKTPYSSMEKEIGKGVDGKGGLCSKLKIVLWFIVFVAVIYVAIIVLTAL